jgi:hypothetical protein
MDLRTERSVIFRELEPPPGGAAKLRERLRASGDSQAVPAWWLGPVAVAVVAAVAVLAFRLVPDAARSPEAGSLIMAAEFDRLLRRPPEPYDLVVRRGAERIAVSELETRDPTVRVFHIEGASDDDDAAENASP